MRLQGVHQVPTWLLIVLLKTSASALATTTTVGGGASKSHRRIVMYSTASMAIATSLPPNRPSAQSPQPVMDIPLSRHQQHHSQQQQQSRAVRNNNNNGSPLKSQEQILLRLARPSDVRGTSLCNSQTLPETYFDQFYLSHFADSPALSFVAVIDTSSSKHSTEINKGVTSMNTMSSSLSSSYITGRQQSQPQQPLHSNYEPVASAAQQQPLHSNYEPLAQTAPQHPQHAGLAPHVQARFSSLQPPSPPTTAKADPQPMVVAYLLGKVRQQQQEYLHIDRLPHDRYGSSRTPAPCIVGHVSSLVVLPDYRRQGLADAMLEQFHAQLQDQSPYNNVASTGLHVRADNRAAVELYKKWGYTKAASLPAYYEDGVDAYYMRKRLQLSRSDFPVVKQLPRVVGGIRNIGDETVEEDTPRQMMRASL